MAGLEVRLRLPEIDKHIASKGGPSRNVSAVEIALLSRWVQKMVSVVRLNWPVDTGASRAAWSGYVVPQRGNLHIVLTNDMVYTEFITTKGTATVSEGGTAWYKALMVQIWDTAKPNIIREVNALVDKGELAKLTPPKRRRGAAGDPLARLIAGLTGQS